MWVNSKWTDKFIFCLGWSRWFVVWGREVQIYIRLVKRILTDFCFDCTKTLLLKWIKLLFMLHFNIKWTDEKKIHWKIASCLFTWTIEMWVSTKWIHIDGNFWILLHTCSMDVLTEYNLLYFKRWIRFLVMKKGFECQPKYMAFLRV